MEPNTIENEPELNYTVASAARRLNTTYQKIMYAIARKWIVPVQQEPDLLISESELFRYAHDRGIDIP
jgi:hypothetical protein